jgi:hypothetical protein
MLISSASRVLMAVLLSSIVGAFKLVAIAASRLRF